MVIQILLARWAPQPLTDGSILPRQVSASKTKSGVITVGCKEGDMLAQRSSLTCPSCSGMGT